MTWKERRIVTILTTIVLVLAAALLIVLGIRFREWRAAQQADPAGASTDGTAADPAAYTSLTYDNGAATLSFAQNDSGAWVWTADETFPLDDTVIREILDLLVNWNPQQTLTDEAALESSGLDESTASLTAATADGTTTTVLFGRTTTDGTSYYVRLNGDESTVYIIADTLYQLMSTTIYDMCRLPELPALTEADIQSVTIQGPAPEDGSEPASMVLTTQQTEDGTVTWRYNGTDVTDNATVRSLLEDLTALAFARCVDYNPSEEAVSICGLDEPETTVRIAYTNASGNDAELLLTVGERLPDRSGRYTRMDDDTTIYLLETDLLDPLMRVAASGLET